MKYNAAIFLALLFFPITAPAKPVTYVIDPEQTQIRIAVKMCEADLLMGTFPEVEGEIVMDESNIKNSSVRARIKAASGVYNKEFHKEDPIKGIIEGPKILNTAVFPDISFISTKIEKTGPNTGFLYGKMTLLGITRPIKFEATFHNDAGMTEVGRELAAFSAYGTFKRSEWKANYGLDRTGIRRMGDDVMVMLTVTAKRK